jgi:hypothetical protein
MIHQFPNLELDPEDFRAVLIDYLQEGETPFHYFEKQKLLVINVNFVSQVWAIGTTEPLTIDNIQKAAEVVGRLRFEGLEKVRISFSEFWPK